MNNINLVVVKQAKTGLPTPTRRKYVPVGSIQASMPSTVGLGQSGSHRLQPITARFFNHSLPPLDKGQEG